MPDDPIATIEDVLKRFETNMARVRGFPSRCCQRPFFSCQTWQR
jgi:hypothetical protein